MKFLKIVLFLLFYSCLSYSQNNLAIDLNGGAGGGWWMHNYGSTHPDTINNRGWSRSRLNEIFNIQGSVLYRMDKLKIGIGIGYHTLADNFLDGNNHRQGTSDRVRIGENNTHFWNYSLIGEYSFFQNERWELFTIHGQIGTFTTDTVHPDRERFGRQMWTVIGLKNTFRWKYADIYLNATYRNASIVPNDDLYFNERHDIAAIGGNLGICFWIF